MVSFCSRFVVSIVATPQGASYLYIRLIFPMALFLQIYRLYYISNKQTNKQMNLLSKHITFQYA